MSTRRSRKIENLAPPDQIRVGMASEDRIESLLRELASSGHVHHYYRSDEGGELDRQGIDFLVYPEAGWMIPLQVKSSFGGARDHVQKYGHGIPFVVVNSGCDDNFLKQVILEALGLQDLTFP